MDARSIIAAVRDKRGLSRAAAEWFANGLASGEVTDAQGGAFAMAVLLNGLGAKGRVTLTEAMRDTGDVLAWDLPGPVVDKHSTGGIGDSVSLPLAAALAACGAYVPMVSGRGLGHTGGTLDKLEAIPGYRTDVPVAELRRIVKSVGCAIVGASARIAPADRRLYGIRDISSTVESIDLITASMLSKKLSMGLGALVLDVKCGSGAFMANRRDARALARALVATANGAGCRTSALITDMYQPLARTAGNAVEVLEAMDCLTGATPGGELLALTVALGGEALHLSGISRSAVAGERKIRAAIRSGAAAERFGRMVAALGGPKDFVENYARHLPAAKHVRNVAATAQGHVTAIDGRRIGEAVVHLGGGRLKGGDPVDPSVGFSRLAKIGDRIGKGDPLAIVHARDAATAARASAELVAAYRLGARQPAPRALVLERIG